MFVRFTCRSCVLPLSPSAPPPLSLLSLASQDGRVDTFISDRGKVAAPHGKGSPSTKGGRRMEGSHREVVPPPQPGKAVSFTDFHKCGFTIPASDFLRGFLREYGV
jgi:hypothetical protein